MMPQPQPQQFVPSVMPQQVPEQWLWQLQMIDGRMKMVITIFGVSGQHVSIMDADVAVQLFTDALGIARDGAGKIWIPPGSDNHLSPQ